MSYFDGCENCGIDFPKRQYVFAWCEKCLTALKCRDCGQNMTMDDHRRSLYHDECMQCFGQEQQKKIIEAQEYNKKIQEKSKYSKLSNDDLEKAWQSSANEIALNCQLSWKKDQTKELSDKYHKLATEAQEKQGEIQKEITKRH